MPPIALARALLACLTSLAAAPVACGEGAGMHLSKDTALFEEKAALQGSSTDPTFVPDRKGSSGRFKGLLRDRGHKRLQGNTDIEKKYVYTLVPDRKGPPGCFGWRSNPPRGMVEENELRKDKFLHSWEWNDGPNVHSVASDDNALYKLFRFIVRNPNENGGGEESSENKFKGLVVFNDGIKGHTLRYLDFFKDLAVKGFVVAAQDRSDDHKACKGYLHEHDQVVEDAVNLVKWVRAKKEYANLPIFLVGHSHGGLVTWSLMLKLLKLAAGEELLKPAGVVVVSPALKIVLDPLSVTEKFFACIGPRLPCLYPRLPGSDPVNPAISNEVMPRVVGEVRQAAQEGRLRDVQMFALTRGKDAVCHHGGVPAICYSDGWDQRFHDHGKGRVHNSIIKWLEEKVDLLRQDGELPK